jgi:hypothetical protein
MTLWKPVLAAGFLSISPLGGLPASADPWLLNDIVQTTGTLADSDLALQRGGTDVRLNDIHAGANLTNNSAFNDNTGNNAITEGAFTGTAGLPMVIQNSGNNVIIQNATILNVNMK